MILGLVPAPAASLTSDLQSLLFYVEQLPLKPLVNILETENPTDSKSDNVLPEGTLESDVVLLNTFNWVILFLTFCSDKIMFTLMGYCVCFAVCI